MKTSLFSRRSPGFSLVEVLTTVAVLGLFAAVACQVAGDLHNRFRGFKLESDVSTVNAAIKVYVANGGSLAGVTDPGEIIGKLKTVRNRDSAARYVGFRGSMLDARLTPVMQSEAESTTGRSRVRWNAGKAAFEISNSGEGGISQFSWDAAAAARDFGEEERNAGAVSYNENNGWIWAYRDSSGPGRVSPTEVALGSAGPGALPGPGAAPHRLASPVFATPPGTYNYADFPSVVSITNPNPEGSSVLWVATIWDGSGVQWTPYTGPLAVQPGTQILACARPDTSGYLDSFTVGGVYVRRDFPLEAPRIVSSAPYLNLESNDGVTLELIDSNPDFAAHRMEYSINGGDYQVYGGPVSLSPSSYANGFAVVARSTPVADGVIASPEANQALNLKLRLPLIDLGTAIPAPGGSSIPVSLTNPNPAGSSTLLYAVRNEGTGSTPSFQPYQGPFSVLEQNYPDGFTVVAYASPVSGIYLESDKTTSVLTFFGIPVTGSTIFVLDRSGSMAWDDGIGQVKEEMNRVLDLMMPADKFGIIKFSTDASVVMNWTAATSNKIRTAKNRVNDLTADGWTNYSEALAVALQMARSSDVKQVVFLSDGAPTTGVTNPDSILSLVRQIVAEGTRVDTLAFGMITPDGRDLLERMDAAGNLTR